MFKTKRNFRPVLDLSLLRQEILTCIKLKYNTLLSGFLNVSFILIRIFILYRIFVKLLLLFLSGSLWKNILTLSCITLSPKSKSFVILIRILLSMWLFLFWNSFLTLILVGWEEPGQKWGNMVNRFIRRFQIHFWLPDLTEILYRKYLHKSSSFWFSYIVYLPLHLFESIFIICYLWCFINIYIKCIFCLNILYRYWPL